MMRNIILPVIFVLLPVALMNVIPRIATQEVKNLTFSVVDNDHSPLSQRLAQKVAASTYFTLVGGYATQPEAMSSIESCDADILLVIEPHFERDLINMGVAHVSIDGNAVNGMKGSLGTGYMSQIVADYATELRDEAGGASSMPLSVQPRYLYNQSLDYKLYMIPALMALLLVILVGFLPALNIVGEKEKGTIEQINVTPVSKLQFILSKLIPYAVVGLFLLTAAILFARLFHGFWPVGQLWKIYVFALVFIAVVASVGLIISNYSGTTRQAALTFFFFMMIFVIMSGLLTPVISMPLWAQRITLFNPMRYFMEAMRTLYMKDVALDVLSQQLLRLSVMAVVMWSWAIVSYRKNS